MNGLGMIRWQLGETDQGLSDVEQALAIFRDLGARDGIAGALNNLGVLHRRLGETEEAITFYEEALGLYRELEDRREEGLILGNIGVLLTQQGKLEEAADHLQSALDIWTARGDLRRMAFARSRLGEVRKRQGRLDDALQDFEEALDLRRRTGNRRGLATTLNGLGTTHLLRGEHPQAKACYEEALAIYREIGDQRGEAITELNLGRLHSTMGEAQRALDLHVQAAPFLRELGDRQIQASNLYGSARALHDLADFEAARERLASTLEHVEELRAETSRQALRIAFFATKQHYHDLYIDVLMHLDEENPQAGHASAAFEAAERRRARALLDVLGEKATDIRQHADPALLEEERSEQRKLNALERRRTALAGRSPGNNEEELTSLEQAERRSRLELDRIRGKIRSTSPRYADLTQPEPCSLAAIQSGLGGNTLLLSYALGEERSFLWLVSKDEIRSHELPGREKIEEDVLEAHRLLTQRRRGVREDRERHLARLSEMLLGPVADGLGTRRLVIVAEDALLYLPFAALPKPETAGSTLLIDHHEIVYLPSASVLLNLRRELAGRHPAPKQLAIFADPVFAPGGSAGEGRSGDREERPEGGALSRSAADFGIETFDPLHHTREEAEAISELAQGEVMKALGLEASKKRVLEGGLHEYQILHFATHGLLNREHPELSGLVLSLVDERGLPQDGFLRLHEIYNLRLSAELVVLSACRTGLGREVRGEGLLGLTRGFMYAGVPRVVVSLWNVSDRATSELMKRFYWCLLKTEASPATALRAAQLSIRDDEEEEQWRHPHYWAGFVLQGEWRLPGQSEDDSWIEGSYTGAAPDDEEDVDYPGPDEVWCDGLTEPWAQKLCHILRRLTSPAGG
ncbi:MAG: CHAT domain-containing protein [bacterium]|nr:CHAT domain-containing protein [bacterium]